MNLHIQRSSWGSATVVNPDVVEGVIARFPVTPHQTPQEAYERAEFFIAAWAMRDWPEFQLLAKRLGVDLSQVTR